MNDIERIKASMLLELPFSGQSVNGDYTLSVASETQLERVARTKIVTCFDQVFKRLMFVASAIAESKRELDEIADDFLDENPDYGLF